MLRHQIAEKLHKNTKELPPKAASKPSKSSQRTTTTIITSSMIRTMATRRAAMAASTVVASTLATATYVSSCQEDQEQNDKTEHSLTFQPMTVPFDAAHRLLEETSLQLYKLQTSTSDSLRDAKTRVVVTGRFVDLLIRSAYAILDYKLAKLLNGDDADLTCVHERTSQSMYEACASHGGVLVKVGQYLVASGGGFIPQVYIDALRPLQDECAPLPLDEIEQVLEQEMRVLYGEDYVNNGPLWKQSFSEIDPQPLGSASLAQVHKATLHDGRQVAIKIQRPNLDKTLRADMLALSLLSKAVERAFPGAGFDWMLPEFHKTIVAELDFTQEAVNAERCDRMVGGSRMSTGNSIRNLFRNSESLPKVIIPKTMPELTTSRLLTMSFEEGFRMTDTEKLEQNGIDPRQVAASACALFGELIMVHGFVHADPHSGNVLVRPRLDASNKSTGEFDIVLLDHGMYRRLDEKFRSNYCNLWAGLVTGDDKRALEGVRGLGLPDRYLDLMGLMLTYRLPSGFTGQDSIFGRQKLGSVMDRSKRHELREHLKARFGDEVFTPSSMNEFMESHSRDLLFCLRCTNLVRGMNRDLGGSTKDRLVSFGAAASRGAKLSSKNGDLWTGAISKEEANVLTQSNSDILAEVKESMNKPVASEIRAMSKGHSTTSQLTPFSISNTFESLNILFRTWYKGLLIDFFLMLRGSPVGGSINSERIG